MLKLFELWERRDNYVKEFSGGMKRRLEIARGFLHTPKILFLDEPTLGLDPQSRNQLWTHVIKQNREEAVTVFLTTHYMDEAERVADRIAIIDHGKIIAAGTLDDPSWVVPVAHIWTSRAAPSAHIPEGVYVADEGPADRNELIAAFRVAYGTG